MKSLERLVPETLPILFNDHECLQQIRKIGESKPHT